MTDTEVKASVRLKGFPAANSLTDAEVQEGIDSARRQIKSMYRLLTYGTFTLRANQQVYDLFSATADVPTSKGVFPAGIRVIELIWNPVDVSGSVSVFGIAPFLQGITLLPGEITTYSFSTPSDWWIWDSNWAEFVRRFGAQPFEHVENRPGAPIRVFPLPSSDQTAFVRYERYRTDAEMQSEDEDWYLDLIESKCALVVSNKLKAVAGTKIGSMSHDGKSSLYWNLYADRKEKEALTKFEAHRYENIGAAQRS
jgi:hypothetical protein